MQEKSLRPGKPDAGLVEKLRRALAAQLLYDSRRLGLDPGEARIAELCFVLLSAPEDDHLAPAWQVRESDLFEPYRARSPEVADYLHLVSSEQRKRFGQFATPPAIVRRMLASVGYTPAPAILGRRLLDPACGSGIFLVEALRIHLRAQQLTGVPLGEWYPRAAAALVGLDIDPTACLFARFNLATVLAPSILRWAAEHGQVRPPPFAIYCLDTLRTFANEAAGSQLFEYEHRPPLRLGRQFDFVTGNPPYHKISPLSPALRQAFVESLYGHPNAYGLFLHAGIEMLADGGHLSFIVPRSMLSGLYFQNLRRFIEKRAAIREIIHIARRRNVFENVLQGTMILTLARLPAPEQSVSVQCVRELADLTSLSAASAAVSQVRITQRLNGLTVWFVDDSAQTYDIIDRIIANHPLLSSLEVGCTARTGQIVWNRVKALLTTQEDPTSRPLVWATDVSRFDFRFNAAGSTRPCYLKLAPTTQSLVVRGPSLLIQRVTADEQPHRLVACVPEAFCAQYPEGYFVENHLNLIQTPLRSQIDLFYLLGLVNSQIAEFFFRVMNGNTQVSATELNLLPVPRGTFESEIAALARRIQECSDRVERDRLETALNQAVASAYGLGADDQVYLAGWLSARRGEQMPV
jgi:adenine-specific DNA-methyltransferase